LSLKDDNTGAKERRVGSAATKINSRRHIFSLNEDQRASHTE